MKRIVFLLISIFSITTVFAQDAPAPEQEEMSTPIEHLTFKGIPIDGTPQEFGRKLEDVGFVYDNKNQGVYWYKDGSFAGYHDCQVAIKSYNNLVYEIVVILPEQYKWNHLYGDYSTLVSQLTDKYGEPIYQQEEFVSTPSYVDIEDDNDKYSEVIDNHCKYHTGFYARLRGTIHIEIKSSGCVGIHYTDAWNEMTKDKAVEEDL